MNEPKYDGSSTGSITIRAIKPCYTDSTPRHWFEGNPYITHLINTLSFQFPSGEEQFVKSVNYFKERITDPKLKRDIRGFIGQESLHGNMHEDFNNWIITLIPDADKYCKIIANRHRVGNQRITNLSPRLSLSITVGFEHMTAIMAANLLRRPDTLYKMDPQVRALLIWHAIEEIEHKSVAFDVYRSVGGSYLFRVLGMIFATLSLSITTTYFLFMMLYRDGELFNFKAAARAGREFFGFNGYFTTLTFHYLKYFSPRFHPSQLQDRELLVEWQAKLADLTPVRVNGRLSSTGGEEVIKDLEAMA